MGNLLFLVISLIVDNFEVDTFVGFELCEMEAPADTLEGFGVASWRIAHSVVPSQKIAKFAFVFVSVCIFAVDG